MAATLASPPILAPVIEGIYPRQGGSVDDQVRGIMTKGWQDWIQALLTRINSALRILRAVTVVTQSGSIVTTPLPLPILGKGSYRVSIYMRVTTPATVNSSLTVTIGGTDDTIAASQTTAAMTSNDVTKPASAVLIANVDNNSPISYATTYASAGATAMVYKLTIIVEALPS